MESREVNSKLSAGIFWQAIRVTGQKGIVFIIGLILVRLLSPADFGLFALASFFVTIFEIFTEGGLGVALVQRSQLSQDDRNFSFTINMLLALCSCLCLFFTSPWIAALYEQPMLSPMIRILSLKILLDTVRTVSFAELRRKLRFKALAIAQVVGMIAGGCCAIVLIFLFRAGVWSLIIQQLITSLTITILYFALEPWVPRICFHAPQSRSLISIGGGLLTMSLLNKISANIYTLIIGKTYTPDILGYYNRAVSVEGMGVTIGITILGESGVTILYRLQKTPEELKKLVLRMLQLGALLIFPMLTGLIVGADAVVETLLGHRWLPAMPMLQIVCATGYFYGLNYYISCVYKAYGRVGIMLGVNIVRQVILLLLALGVCWMGKSIPWLLWSGFIAYAIGFLLDCHYCNKLIGYGLFVQLSVLWKYILCNLVMAVVVCGVKMEIVQHLNCYLALAVIVVTGMISYVAMLWWLRAPLFHETLNLLKAKLLHRPKKLNQYEPGSLGDG